MPGSTADPFGSLLRSFRHRRHLTQQQLATAIGVHRTTIGRWEEGSVLPESKALVLDLARQLHLDDQETRQLLEASLTALAPHWLVPLPRNPFFTGREEILEALSAQLGVDHAGALTQAAALHGLGGVGKTQLALEYAYQHALEYSGVFWISAETEEQIIASLLHLAEALQVPERADQDQQRVLAAVQRWLSTHRGWLLIWDNVEDLALLDRFLLPTRQGAILLTTRLQALGIRAVGLDLAPMDQEEGVLFLLRRAKVLAPDATSADVRQLAARMPVQYAAAVELVGEMGGLPLALDQAGAYLEAARCGLLAYLELFRTRRAVLLQQRGAGVRDHPASVATTFTLALATTVHRHPAVGDLLLVCALLQPDAIPEELFRQGAVHLGATLAAACRDALEWGQVVAAAGASSLLARHPEAQMLALHRLVQAVLRDLLPEAERAEWQARVLAALEAVFPEVLPMTEYASWQQCERLLPHALLCLHRDEAREASLVYASLASKVAQYLRERGRYPEAESLYLSACALREQGLGPDHFQVAQTLTNLAILYTRQGRYTQAEPLFQRALHIGEQTLGPDHPDVARSLHSLATLYYQQGRYAEAEPLYQRALRIGEQALGPNHPQVATSLNNLALLYMEQGRYTEAEPLYQRALDIREQALGPNHPQVASSLNNLALLYQAQGRYAEAEPLYQRALHLREEIQGPDHPDVTHPLYNLAELYREQGRHTEAAPLLRRALALWEVRLGPDHPDVAFPLNSLANFYLEQRRYAEAEPLYQRALRIGEQALGPEHPEVAISLSNLANLYRDQDKEPEPESLYQRALAIREKQLGPHHPKTAETLHEFARLRHNQGNLSEACALAERALAIRSQALGEAHPKTIATRTLYDQLLQEQMGAREKAPAEGSPEVKNGLEAPAPLPVEARASVSAPDPLQAFLEDCCERHPRAWCRSADLWQAYEQWARDHQERYPLARGAFIAQLKAHGCRAARTMTARIWRGIALVKPEA